ncbi:MAG: hypothetical protein IPM99_11090 [Rubrivivax sp.]|nr:hypothetical protein [Rubrivivax sp.]
MVFDQPGIAVLGCNIHDTMAAWVVIVETPHHGQTAANGRLRLDDVPPGSYRLRAWHADLPPARRRGPHCSCRRRVRPGAAAAGGAGRGGCEDMNLGSDDGAHSTAVHAHRRRLPGAAAGGAGGGLLGHPRQHWKRRPGAR